jgi:hypothetical protein
MTASEHGHEHREGDPPDCMECQDRTWKESYLPKIKNLIFVTLASVAFAAVVVFTFISAIQVRAAGHATTTEVKELEEKLTETIKETSKAHGEAMQRVVEEMFKDRRETEKRLDSMMNTILTIPGAVFVPPSP